MSMPFTKAESTNVPQICGSHYDESYRIDTALKVAKKIFHRNFFYESSQIQKQIEHSAAQYI